MLHTGCFMRPTRPHALLKGTSTATFNESRHLTSASPRERSTLEITLWANLTFYFGSCHPSTNAAHIAHMGNRPCAALHLFFTSKVNELHQMTESFQCFQVNRKSVSFSLLCFLCKEPECISVPHLSLSNIWLLVRTFLCLS